MSFSPRATAGLAILLTETLLTETLPTETPADPSQRAAPDVAANSRVPGADALVRFEEGLARLVAGWTSPGAPAGPARHTVLASLLVLYEEAVADGLDGSLHEWITREVVTGIAARVSGDDSSRRALAEALLTSAVPVLSEAIDRISLAIVSSIDTSRDGSVSLVECESFLSRRLPPALSGMRLSVALFWTCTFCRRRLNKAAAGAEAAEAPCTRSMQNKTAPPPPPLHPPSPLACVVDLGERLKSRRQHVDSAAVAQQEPIAG